MASQGPYVDPEDDWLARCSTQIIVLVYIVAVGRYADMSEETGKMRESYRRLLLLFGVIAPLLLILKIIAQRNRELRTSLTPRVSRNPQKMATPTLNTRPAETHAARGTAERSRIRTTVSSDDFKVVKGYGKCTRGIFELSLKYRRPRSRLRRGFPVLCRARERRLDERAPARAIRPPHRACAFSAAARRR